MAIKDVVTRGYISGGGEIALTVTRGYGVGAAVLVHQPGATRQLVQLQAPGRPRIDLLKTPFLVDIEVPAPIDLTVTVEAVVTLALQLLATIDVRTAYHASAHLRLYAEAQGHIAPLEASAAHELHEVSMAELLDIVRDEQTQEEEELWLLGVR